MRKNKKKRKKQKDEQMEEEWNRWSSSLALDNGLQLVFTKFNRKHGNRMKQSAAF